MNNSIYRRENFVIIKIDNSFIVINTNKEFETGHTHLKSYKACKTIIDLALKRKIPRSTGFYFLISIIRISEDLNYIQKIEKLISTRKNKGKKIGYINKKF